MAFKMPSPIDHREDEDEDGFLGQQVQVCQWCQRGGGGVHDAAKEVKDERSRSRSYFIIHRIISHHLHRHKAQINRNIKNHHRHVGLETTTKGQ
jgi:hypothetical protein